MCGAYLLITLIFRTGDNKYFDSQRTSHQQGVVSFSGLFHWKAFQRSWASVPGSAMYRVLEKARLCGGRRRKRWGCCLGSGHDKGKGGQFDIFLSSHVVLFKTPFIFTDSEDMPEHLLSDGIVSFVMVLRRVQLYIFLLHGVEIHQ